MNKKPHPQISAAFFAVAAIAALALLASAAPLTAQTAGPSAGTRSPTTLTTSPAPSQPRQPAATTTVQTYPPPAPAKKSGASSASSAFGSPGNPQSAAPMPSAPLPLATDPSYRLAIGDELSIDVHGEPDMSTAQRIDQQGNVRVPELNEVNLASKNVREAESYLEQLYVEKKLLKKPLVNINVREYASRQVTIIGAVNGPGLFTLPRETDSIEIVELVTAIGGFRPTAKSDAVRVTRTDTETGKETTTYVDVESMIYNKRNALKSFKIFPGDRILVTERIW